MDFARAVEEDKGEIFDGAAMDDFLLSFRGRECEKSFLLYPHSSISQRRQNPSAKFTVLKSVVQMATGETACTYAALILHDDGIPITAEKIATLLKATNVSCESYWSGLFPKLLEKVDVDSLITSVGSGGGVAASVGGAAPAAGGGAAAAAPAIEEKKVKEKEEGDDDMGFSFFD